MQPRNYLDNPYHRKDENYKKHKMLSGRNIKEKEENDATVEFSIIPSEPRQRK